MLEDAFSIQRAKYCTSWKAHRAHMSQNGPSQPFFPSMTFSFLPTQSTVFLILPANSNDCSDQLVGLCSLLIARGSEPGIHLIFYLFNLIISILNVRYLTKFLGEPCAMSCLYWTIDPSFIILVDASNTWKSRTNKCRWLIMNMLQCILSSRTNRKGGAIISLTLG